MKEKALIINTSYAKAYKNAKVRTAIPSLPPLTIAALAAALEREGIETKVLDLNIEKDQEKAVNETIADFEPTHVSISFTTNSFNDMNTICKEARAIDKNIFLIGGGTHASYYPKETLQQSLLDVAVTGEGDISFPRIVKGTNLAEIDGIAYRNANGEILVNPQNGYMKDLDVLPFPAWHLFDIKAYKVSKLISRKAPVGPIETSRGCLFSCTYCTKSVFGQTWRYKSAERVVAEIEKMVDYGFKEFHVVDDMFTTNKQRAKDICNMMIDKKIPIVYNLRNGIRVNSVDDELVKLLKESGCYRASFGIESGNQKVLNGILKGVKVEQVREAMKLFKQHSIERLGFFMFGLPDDTEQSMQQTIDFALELDPEIAKASISTPFPGTPLYEIYQKKNLLLTEDWDKFMTHDPKQVYKHPILDWETIYEYYSKFYRAFYLRPEYATRRLVYGVTHGTLFADIQSFFKTDWN
ncbi:MAG: radical SAM protein [archaeon]|nr:radical SAM protein [archaeon]